MGSSCGGGGAHAAKLRWSDGSSADALLGSGVGIRRNRLGVGVCWRRRTLLLLARAEQAPAVAVLVVAIGFLESKTTHVDCWTDVE